MTVFLQQLLRKKGMTYSANSNAKYSNLLAQGTTEKRTTVKLFVLAGLIAALFLSFAAVSLISNAEALGPWRQTTSYPTPGIVDTSCLTSGGFAYCVGGENDSFEEAGLQTNFTSYVFYTPLQPTGGVGSWVRTTNYPLMVNAPSCVQNSGYIYCVGGANPYCPYCIPTDTNAAYYAPISPLGGIGAWQETTSYPMPIVTDCVAALSSIYCIAGSGTNAVYYASLSPSGIGSWTATTNYPNTSGGSCFAVAAEVYCAGGANDTYYATASSSGLSSWTSTSPPPVEQASCLPLAGYAYCIGGGNSTTFHTDQVFYAQVSPTGFSGWTQTTPYPGGGDAATLGMSCFAGIAAFIDIDCVGGTDGTFAITNSVFYSGLQTQTVTVTTDLSGTFTVTPVTTVTTTTTTLHFTTSTVSTNPGTATQTVTATTTQTKTSTSVPISTVTRSASGTATLTSTTTQTVPGTTVTTTRSLTSLTTTTKTITSSSTRRIGPEGRSAATGNSYLDGMALTSRPIFAFASYAAGNLQWIALFLAPVGSLMFLRRLGVSRRALKQVYCRRLLALVFIVTVITFSFAVPYLQGAYASNQPGVTMPPNSTSSTISVPVTTLTITTGQTITVTAPTSTLTATDTVTGTSTFLTTVGSQTASTTTTTVLSTQTQTITDTSPSTTTVTEGSSSITVTSTVTTQKTSTVTSTTVVKTSTVTTTVTSYTGTGKSSTRTKLDCRPSEVTLGSATKCTATVRTSSGAPSGIVEFSASGGGKFAKEVCVSNSAKHNEKCQVNYTPNAKGSQTLTANYAGDSSHSPSHGQFAISVKGSKSSAQLQSNTSLAGTYYEGIISSVTGPSVVWLYAIVMLAIGTALLSKNLVAVRIKPGVFSYKVCYACSLCPIACTG